MVTDPESAPCTFTVLTDQDIRETLSAEDAVAWMREAILAEREGRLVSPPRVAAMFDGGRLVMTAGAMADDSYGYRVYDTFGLDAGEQVVVAHDARTGAVRAIAVGSEIGLRRTAALGGVAHDALAPRRPLTVGVIGTGNQARGQVWALHAVRQVRTVRIFSRDPGHRENAASGLDQAYPFSVHAVDSAHEAVAGADVVILATTSPTPVIRTDWLADDAYVATLGPKQVGRAEYDEELLRGADVITTDSLQQLGGYDLPTVAAESGITVTPLRDHLVSSPKEEGRKVYLSVGLSGTEPYLLGRLAQQLAGG
jgi:ornithine cyclodeaminase/alanine dehydrogenase-like protein (mu-crystallin family)